MACLCGCGAETPLAKKTRRGLIAGQPVRFLPGHGKRKLRERPAEKLCSGCRQTKSADEFYPNASRRDGLSGYCRVCHRLEEKCRMEANPGLKALRSRLYRKNNPEVTRATVRRYASKDIDRTRLLKRNREAKRRALKYSVPVEVIDAMQVYERGRGVCGICGRRLSRKSFHLDHIVPLAKGGSHVYANVQATHPRCNLSKGAKIQ